jgi:DNA-binding phage protein
MNNDELIEELGKRKYNLSKIEKDLGIPKNSLYQALKQKRSIPLKYQTSIYHYIQTNY